jgi:hypothetical protein
MKSRRDYLVGMVTGMMVVAVLMLLMGAYTRRRNIEGISVVTSMTCSDDGKIIYVVDEYGIHRSRDFGENWTLVAERDNVDRL